MCLCLVDRQCLYRDGGFCGMVFSVHVHEQGVLKCAFVICI